MKTPITILTAAIGLAAFAGRAQLFIAGVQIGTRPGAFAPEEFDSSKSGRRAVTWFRHAGDPAWGDSRTDYVDRFSVVKPVDGDAAGRPLLVVLHWRGAGWPGKGVDMQTELADDKDRVFSAPDDFYILNLDDIRDYNVLLNRTHDQYWWGATPLYAGPTVADVPRLVKGETPCEKRVLASIEWTIERYGIDRDRVYLCGNSMGGQAAEAIGLNHGEIFAAVNANVPATVWFAAARLGFVNADGSPRVDTKGGPTAEPPFLVEWSGVDDKWSRDREVMLAGLRRRHWAHIVLWGDYGHCGLVSEARRKNDLVEKFDWLALRRNEAYPVFTEASCDDAFPWPFAVFEPKRASFSGWKGDIESAKMKIAEGAKSVGQVNAFFRWRVIADTDREFAIELRLASPGELATERFAPPERATATVGVRRIQSPAIAGAKRLAWSFGDRSGTVERDESGTLAIPGLELAREPRVLKLATAVR